MEFLSHLWNDVRFSVRSSLRRPTFAAVVILTLALGIGINVAVFSLAENTLLRTLPVPEPQRLVNLADPGARNVGRVNGFPAFPRPSESGTPETVFSYGMFRDLEREQEPFVGLAAHRVFHPIISAGEGGQSARGFLVSGSYFPVLGLQPALGRLLGPLDDQIEGVAESVVLSYSYWQSNFEGDPEVLGRTLLVDNVPLTVVGVAPEGFRGTVLGSSYTPVSVFAPISMEYSGNPFDQRHIYWAHLFGRLKPGVSLDAAAAAMSPLFRGILSDVEAPQLLEVTEQEREAFRSRSLVLKPGARGQTGSNVLSVVQDQFSLLLALSGVVLLLCCANVGGLILLRSTTRSGEMAIRTSMGASRARLASLLFTESLVLTLPASLLSLAVAAAILRSSSLLSGLPARISWISDAMSGVNVSAAAALVAIGVAVLSAVIIGLFPLRRLVRTEPAKVLQAHGAKQTTSKGIARFRAALATVQIALSMALLTMTGAFVYSLSNIARVDIGIDIDSVAMISVALPGGQTMDRTDLARIEEELGAIPGVTSVAASMLPLFAGPQYPAIVPATVDGVEGPGQLASVRSVSPSFFRTFDIQLLAGRTFDASDGERAVIIVSERFAERYGLALDAIIGRTFDGFQANGEIIGVVADVRTGKVTSDAAPTVFQLIESASSATFYVRSAQSPEMLLSAMSATVNRINPTMPVTNLQSMERHFRESMSIERFLTGTSTVLGVLATLLSALGLYGILAYSVAQRSREIGLRFALGAEMGRIRSLVLRQVIGIAFVGLLLGAILAWPLGRAAQSLLFGVEAGDPLLLAAAASVLVVVMLGAAYIPARRASRVDPMTVLRYE